MIHELKNRIISFFLSILLGILFLYVSVLVDKDLFRTIDYQSMIGIQKLLNSGFDFPFSIFTLIGSSEITFTAVSAIFLYLLIKKRYLFVGIFLFFLNYIFELLGKLLIFHPAPPITLNRYVFDFHLPSSFIVHTAYSFPSGHMARISYLFVILSFIIYKLVKNYYSRIFIFVALFCILSFMFISRIYLGEHWLSDVLGGLILGGAVATLAISFW